MRTRLLRCVAALGLVGLSGCFSPAPPPATVQVAVGEVTVSAYRDIANHKVSVVGSGPDRPGAGSSFTSTAVPAVRFLSFSHPDKGIADTYVYGVAPVGATNVVFTPSAAAARIAPDGTFVALILTESEISAFEIGWQFTVANGAIIAEGTGPTLEDGA